MAFLFFTFLCVSGFIAYVIAYNYYVRTQRAKMYIAHNKAKIVSEFRKIGVTFQDNTFLGKYRFYNDTYSTEELDPITTKKLLQSCKKDGNINLDILFNTKNTIRNF